MKKLVFVLVLVSAPAWAEWTHVGGAVDVDTYADIATIRKKGDTVKTWVLFDYKIAQRDPSGEAFLSRKTQEEFDCDGERDRTLYYSMHSGNVGGGESVYVSDGTPLKWRPIPPGSLIAELWKVACKP